MWNEYHGDTTQYYKIPKSEVPSQISVQTMHDEYCGASNVHAETTTCKEWAKMKDRAQGNVDKDTSAVFDWWCGPLERASTAICEHW